MSVSIYLCVHFLANTALCKIAPASTKCVNLCGHCIDLILTHLILTGIKYVNILCYLCLDYRLMAYCLKSEAYVTKT